MITSIADRYQFHYQRVKLAVVTVIPILLAGPILHLTEKMITGKVLERKQYLLRLPNVLGCLTLSSRYARYSIRLLNLKITQVFKYLISIIIRCTIDTTPFSHFHHREGEVMGLVIAIQEVGRNSLIHQPLQYLGLIQESVQGKTFI